jgi:hypothetical protein
MVWAELSCRGATTTTEDGAAAVSERHDELTDEERDDDGIFLDDDEEEDQEGEEPVTATHPGFTITCEECGSELVVVENDLEFSPAAGRRGNVYLRCTECDAETFLLPPGEDEEEPEEEE